MDSRLKTIIDWISATAAPAHGLLVPVSGGSDGALAFYCCAQAFPEKTLAVFIGSDLRAREWFESVGSVRLLAALEGEQNREVARNAAFLDLCLRENRWLVGTRNRSEDAMGNFSLASRIATYMPLIGTWKSDVMQLCELAGVPTEVTASSRRADPDCGRPKELSEIPLELIDVFLKVKEGVLTEESLAQLNAEQVEYLARVYAANQFKRQLPVRGPATS